MDKFPCREQVGRARADDRLRTPARPASTAPEPRAPRTAAGLTRHGRGRRTRGRAVASRGGAQPTGRPRPCVRAPGVVAGPRPQPAALERPSAPPRRKRHAAGAPAPEVRISIGRVEVHAAPPRPSPVAAAPARRPALSLADYLASGGKAMSDFLAVAGVTAVLRWMLQRRLDRQRARHRVRRRRPRSRALPPDRIVVGDTENPQLNLFMYHVGLNSGWRNVELPERDSGGRRAQQRRRWRSICITCSPPTGRTSWTARSCSAGRCRSCTSNRC